ncbi:MAG: hypothetical protein ACI8PZ_001667 [Myxococcota bacterium]|jgi:hypothetical protein
MEHDELYELVYTAAQDALRDMGAGGDVRLSRRMIGGTVLFRDAEGRTIKEADAGSFFKKVTAVREKLRVLEQKLNSNKDLSHADRAELQTYIARAYGSLTTFNFLFREDADRFRGTGG